MGSDVKLIHKYEPWDTDTHPPFSSQFSSGKKKKKRTDAYRPGVSFIKREEIKREEKGKRANRSGLGEKKGDM